MVNPITKVNIKGFTLIELMIVVSIIAIISAIAYPNYQKSVKKTKRTDMMSALQNIGNQIESRKVMQGTYSNVNVSDLITTYPIGSSPALYNVNISPLNGNNLENGEWTITATPVSGQIMDTDGSLTYDYEGVKCHLITSSDTKCGKNNEWNN